MNNTNWSIEDIGDLRGLTAIVTGANSGIGFETAKTLADKGASVILAVRDEKKGNTAVKTISNDLPNAKIETINLDLSSLESVKKFVDTFSKKHKGLDILVNNAGVMIPPYGKTKDGFELQFGTNHLGHFALTGLLLPFLKQSQGGRIVTVSSLAHRRGNINFEDLNWETRDYNAWQAYADSKIANLYFTHELARKLNDANTKVLASHPGFTRTNLQRNSLLFRTLNPLLSQKTSMGALPSLRAATDKSAQSGEYYGPGGWGEYRGHPITVDSIELAKDEEIAKKLWRVSEDLTGVKFKS